MLGEGFSRTAGGNRACVGHKFYNLIQETKQAPEYHVFKKINFAVSTSDEAGFNTHLIIVQMAGVSYFTSIIEDLNSVLPGTNPPNGQGQVVQR